MAEIEVSWVETCEYTATVEVDGYDADEDPNDEESGVMQAILNLDGEAFDEAFDGCTERSVSTVTVKRAGDLTPEIVPAAPKHEAMF